MIGKKSRYDGGIGDWEITNNLAEVQEAIDLVFAGEKQSKNK